MDRIKPLTDLSGLQFYLWPQAVLTDLEPVIASPNKYFLSISFMPGMEAHYIDFLQFLPTTHFTNVNTEDQRG